MISKVQDFIQSNHLIHNLDKLLVAVSGGRDSICLASVLLDLGYSIALGHCNFNLRKGDCDRDEAFVKQWAKTQDIACHTISFDTKAYASEQKISTQMAARDLRYNWLEQLSYEHQYTKIAIAHNSDDVAETFFINLIRGTGLDGLTGIKPKVGNVIRPLLNISRLEIDDYISKNQISYQEDVTNASTKYLRNKIRHLILPEFQHISERFNQTLFENISHLNDSKNIIDNEIDKLRQDLFKEENRQIKISIDVLKDLKYQSEYLFELLKPFRFSRTVVDNIAENLDAESGKLFYSKTHQILKDRKYLILTSLSEFTNNDESVLISKGTSYVEEPLRLCFTLTSDKTIIPRSSIAFLDAKKLTFPLVLRKWRVGDNFVPLGMRHRQKVSDFLINRKVSIIEKENTYVLLSGEEIIWLVGYRIDNRYKIIEKTQSVLKIEIN